MGPAVTGPRSLRVCGAVLRWRPAAVAVIALALTLCLGGSPTQTTAMITLPRARSIMAAINLKSRDLPGFSASPLTPRLDARGAVCAGIRPARTVAASDDFEVSGASVDTKLNSVVALWSSPAIARTQLRRTNNRRGQMCLVQDARRAVTGAGYQVLHVSSAPLRRIYVSGTIGWRITLLITKAGIRQMVVYDLVTFTRGSFTVGLTVGSGPRPFPQAFEHTLVSILVGRARRYIH